MGMKRFLMIILSFIFLGGAVTGSALLLSGCQYEQTESGDSQDGVLDDNQNNEGNTGESTDEATDGTSDGEIDNENPDEDDETETKAVTHNFYVIAQFRTSSSSYSDASTSTSSPSRAISLRWYDSNGTISWGGTRTVNSGASNTSGDGYIYASYLHYTYDGWIRQGRYVMIAPYSYSGYTCVGMTTSSSWTNTSYTTENTSTRYFNGSLYSSKPSTSESVTGSVYVKFRKIYDIDFHVWTSVNTYDSSAYTDRDALAGVGFSTPSSVPDFDGYTFIGWSTTQNDTTPTYAPGEELPDSLISVGRTFYACYERDPYVLTINYYSRNASNTINLGISSNRGTVSSSSISLNGSATVTADGTSTHTITISKSGSNSGSYYYYIGTSSSATTVDTYTYSWSPTSDRTISIYVVQRYTITYNGNGSTSGSTSTTYKRHGTNATIASNGFSRTGHTFQGWATSLSGSVRYDPGDSYSTNANETLYAVWEADTLTNRYYYRNTSGSRVSTTQTFNYGQSFTFLSDSSISNEYTANGWSLMLWATNSTTTNEGYPVGEEASSSLTTSGRTFYAISARSVSITYNTGGGSSVSSTTGSQWWNQYGNRYSNPTMTISSTRPTRSGYTFKGWATSSGSSTVRYDPGDSYTFSRTYSQSASVTLYAVWEKSTFDVTLTVNFIRNYGTYDVPLEISGTGLTSKRIYEDDTATFTYETDGSASSITVSVREKSPAPNYFYVGTSSTPTNLSSYSFTWSRNSDKTVNIYTEQRYTITYNGNGSTSGSTSPTYYRYNSWPTIASNGFNRTGYTFAGWSTSSTGSSVDYRPGNSYTQNGYPTLYAVWTRITYTITYNSNGGSGTMSSTTKYYGTSVTLRANTFTRTGYHFAGWALSSTGSVVYDDQDTYSTNASDTLYAKWTANTYYVNFNSNGGSGTMTRQTFTYGTYQNLKSNTFTRTGYTFTGWNRNSAGTSTSYSNGQSVRNLTSTNGGSVTLYAQWKINVEAKYDSAGGYWYVENGKIPQTRVTSSSLITNINNSTTWGQTYYFAGQSVRAKTYGGVEYCQWNGNWYEVEPIRWRLTKNSSQADGYATTTDTDAVLAKIVYVDQYSSTYLGSGAGYSAEAVTEFLKNGISTSYLVSYTRSTQTFGNGTTLYGSANVTANMFVSSQKEIESVSNSTAIEFSDLAKDIIKYYGGTNVYFTRDLGSNYNNITCFNGAGKDTQRLATDYRGVQFTLRFTEYTCVA